MELYYPLMSALATAIAFGNGSFGILSFISLVPLLLNIINGKKVIYSVFIFTFVYHFFLLIWLYELAPLAQINLSLFPSLILLTIGNFIASFTISVIFTLPFLLCKANVLNTVCFCLIFSFSEWLIGNLGVLSFPWGRLGTLLYDYPMLLKPASIFGALGVSLFILVVNFLIATFILKKKNSIYIAVLLLSGNLLWGVTSFALNSNDAKEIPVAIIQGGLGSGDKWQATAKETIERYLLMSYSAAIGTELIVFPETAIPVNLLENKEITNIFKDFSAEFGVTIIIGAFEKSESKSYNALYAFTSDKQVSLPQYKRKLVPFGEFLPFPVLLGSFVSNDNFGITPGIDGVIFSTDFANIGSLICYESIFPQLSREIINNNADLLVLSSNDSWFGESVALNQHFGHSVLRAVETGRYLLRAGNTGISAIIDNLGRVISKAEISSPQVLKGICYTKDYKTIYSIIGDVIALPGGLLVFYSLYVKLKNYITKKQL